MKILARYPDLAEELRPYLITAVDLTQLARPGTIAAQQSSKDAFLRQAAALQVERSSSPSGSTWLRRLLATGLAALLFLFAGSTMLAFASTEAIPGDTLYGAKLFLEQMQLTYSANPQSAAQMIERFHQERIEEVAALLSLNRHQPVTFSGVLEERKPDQWIVEGIPVVISSGTVVPDEVDVGFLVQITGTTDDGLVMADRIDVVHGNLPEPELDEPAPPEGPSSLPTPLPSLDPVVTPDHRDRPEPADDLETNTPAITLTVTPDDDASRPAGAGDDLPGDNSGHSESEESHEDSDLQEPDEDSGGSSGSGGDEHEIEESDQQEQEEDNKDSSSDKEENNDSDEEQQKEGDSKDSSDNKEDEVKDDSSHNGNSGKGSSNESDDTKKED